MNLINGVMQLDFNSITISNQSRITVIFWDKAIIKINNILLKDLF